MEQTPEKWAGRGIVHPVEELFELRAQIRALRARETELCHYFLGRAGPHERSGPFHQIQICESQSRRFIKSRLPQAILGDSKYYKTRQMKQVRILRQDQSQPGGFSAPVLASPSQGWLADPPADDFAVVEPFYG